MGLQGTHEKAGRDATAVLRVHEGSGFGFQEFSVLLNEERYATNQSRSLRSVANVA